MLSAAQDDHSHLLRRMCSIKAVVRIFHRKWSKVCLLQLFLEHSFLSVFGQKIFLHFHGFLIKLLSGELSIFTSKNVTTYHESEIYLSDLICTTTASLNMLLFLIQ